MSSSFAVPSIGVWDDDFKQEPFYTASNACRSVWRSEMPRTISVSTCSRINIDEATDAGAKQLSAHAFLDLGCRDAPSTSVD